MNLLFLRSALFTATVVPRSLSLVAVLLAALRPSDMSVLRRATQRNIPEVGIGHSHRRENLEYYIVLTGWLL
jgi:hypothetical protein